MSQWIQFQKKNNVAFVTLNRPEKRNALVPGMISEMQRIFLHVKKEPALKALVLQGKGPVFCSGADLHWLAGKKTFKKQHIQALFDLLKSVYECPLPVITVVQGFVVGGGVGLVAASDIVLAQLSTKFLFSEVRWGLAPSVISPFVLKKLPLSQAQFWMLTARPFKASEARAFSLVHFVDKKPACGRFLNQLLKFFQNMDGQVVLKTKKLLRKIHLLPLNQTRSLCVDLLCEMRKNPQVQKNIHRLLGQKPKS